MKYQKDDIEYRILAALQGGLSVRRDPYGEVAREAGVSTDTLLGVLDRWNQNGTLRRVGAVVNHWRVGVSQGAMVVWIVPPERREAVGAILAGFDEVSHAYERQTRPQWPYSLYTMVHGKTPEAVRGTIQRMGEAVAITDYITLSTCRELKKAAPRYID